MTRETQYTNVMIIYLLIGCLLQTTVRGAATAGSVAKAVIDEGADAVGQTGERLSALLSETGATVRDFGSETTKAAEQAIRAGGRATLALGYLFSQLLNGLSATVATGTGLLASGASTVHGALNGVPVVRVVSAGIDHVANGLAGAVGEVSQNARQTRKKMMQTLREQLDQSDAATATAGVSASASATAEAGAGADAEADA